MQEARAAVKLKSKAAKTDKEKKDANDEIKKLQSDFLKDNADLLAKLKAIDEQKKAPHPSKGG